MTVNPTTGQELIDALEKSGVVGMWEDRGESEIRQATREERARAAWANLAIEEPSLTWEDAKRILGLRGSHE